MEKSAEARWLATWRDAAPVLEELRRRELHALTPERALFFSAALLSLVRTEVLPERRRSYSGLVDLQALFRLVHPR